MKNLILVVCTIILTNISCARQVNFNRFSGMHNNRLSMPVYNLDSSGVKSGYISDISIKVTRNFHLKFKTAADISWVNTTDGPVAYFTMDGIKMKQAFTKNGNFDYLMSYYDEKRLPKEVRHLVKREYYDYNIFLVIEIQQYNKKVYVIKLQSHSHLKTVKVDNGEIEIIEEYIRN